MTRTTTGRGLEIVLCVVLSCTGAGLTGCGSAGRSVESSVISTTPATSTGAAVELAQVTRTWPSSWTATGTHSEATYVEHLTMSRRADTFSLRIVITAQGAQAGGTWNRVVRVDKHGRITDLDPAACGGSCSDLDGTRGYLAGAALLSLQRSANAPTTGVTRRFGTRDVLCVDGAQLYSPAGMATDTSLQLDPCFDSASGAVVAQYAPTLGTFSGPTLDTDTLRITEPFTPTPAAPPVPTP